MSGWREITIKYQDDEDLVVKLRALLESREDWVTPKTLRERYQITPNALWKRLSQWRKAGLLKNDHNVNLTAGGRLRMLKLTPILREKMNAIRPHNRTRRK